MTPERARKILEVAPDAGLEEARRAFRAKVKRLHPDHAGARRRLPARELAYNDVVAAWRAIQDEARPRARQAAPAAPPPPEPVRVAVTVSWLSVKLGDTLEVEADGRRLRLPLPTDARPGDRLRVRGTGGAPDVIVTLQMSRRSFAESLQRFVDDFLPGRAKA